MQRRCRAFGNTCKYHEEKQTDVAIAVQMVGDALLGKVDRLVLLTADSDQIPAAKFLQTLPGIELSLMYLPDRMSHARDLGNQIADRAEITSGRLGTCVLPRTVRDKNGRAVAFRPALYDVA